MNGTAKNRKTGEERIVKMSPQAATKVILDGTDKCSGKCRCTVEPDGHCPNGWPSRSLAVGII